MLKAVKQGNFAARIAYRRDGVLAGAGELLNDIIALNEHATEELLRVGRVVGQEGRMTERASVGPARGAWAAGMNAVNQLIGDLVAPTNEVARVITAVATGGLAEDVARHPGPPGARRVPPHRHHRERDGGPAQLLRGRDDPRREGGRQRGEAGRQAAVKGLSGTWKDLTDNVNGLAANLTAQVRNIAKVTTAVARGDLSQKSPSTPGARSSSSRTPST